MRSLTPLVLCAMMAGCASMPDEATPPYAQQECKAVAVYTGAEAIRNDVHGTTTRADSMARAEGAMGLARTKLENPPELRSPPGTGLLHDALRHC